MRLQNLLNNDKHASLRFVLPVIGENMLTISIGLVFSQIISGISASALAAIGMANTVQNLVFALFSMVTTGASVLVARRIGEGDYQDASKTIEQASLLSVVFSTTIAALCIAFAQPILRLLMQNAEDALFGEAVSYFRILMLSLPCYVLHSTHSTVFRSMGDGKTPLRVAMLMNIVQLAAGYLFISVLHLEEIGAGLAYVLCRLVGCGMILYALLHDHRYCAVSLRRMLKPDRAACSHIMRIGAPLSVESMFVQVGYLLANSMAIALGTAEAAVYQILNTLNAFIGLPQNVTGVVSVSIVGRLIGEGKPGHARRSGRVIWATSLAVTVILGIFLLLFAKPIVSIYTSDEAIATATAGLMWCLLMLNLPAASINAIDPQLRAGGAVRFVMFTAVSAVWVIRLPLTYLFCFVLDYGVAGIFVANTIALIYRAVTGFVCHCGSKWIKKKL